MRKGQTCSNCAGDCCTLRGKAPPGSWYQNHFKQCKVRTLKEHGGFVISEATEFRCLKQLPDGSCFDYNNRPALCRSYYCYGKLWRPKPEVRELPIDYLRGKLKKFCVDQLGQMFDGGSFDRFAQLLGQAKGKIKISFSLEIPEEAVRRLKK